MSWIDIVLALFIVIGCFQGYKAGFLPELFSLIAVVLGVIGGFKLMGRAMVLLAHKFSIDEKILPYIAFAVVFIVIVISVNLLGKLVKASLHKSFLGNADQVAGALLGLVRTIFMLSVALWIIDSLKLKFLSQWTENSWLYYTIAGFAPKITDWIGNQLPIFRDVF